MAKNKKNFVPSVSVIIPMYNAEKYIEQCLQSLLSQTLKNFEVIVVDDCSTDKSFAIVKKISTQFEGRLVSIKMQKNSGYPGLPRNFALNSARGEYIYFLDSDDFISKTALEELYNTAKEFDADVVHAEKYFTYIEKDGESASQVHSFQLGEFVDKPTLETSDIGERVTDFIQKKYLWWACNKLFRRSLLTENKITFPAMTSFEDYVFLFQCLISAKNYVRVPFVSYYYRLTDNSLSHKPRYVSEVVKNMATAISIIDNFMSSRKFFIDNPQFKYSIVDFFVQWRIDTVSKKFFLEAGENVTLAQLYENLRKNAFAEKKLDQSALLSYLFVSTSLYKLNTKHQANQIAELKNQLAKLQNQGE